MNVSRIAVQILFVQEPHRLRFGALPELEAHGIPLKCNYP